MKIRTLRSIGLGTVLANLIFQRILRINHKAPFMVHYTSRINSPKRIEIINDNNSDKIYNCFAVSIGCYIQAKNTIQIYSSSMFAPGVKIISANHNYKDLSAHEKERGIVIGKNVWIGANVTILPGVNIGDNTIIGAGSVVTKSMPSNSICVGIPCKVIRRKDD